jgi:hypothetical protein
VLDFSVEDNAMKLHEIEVNTCSCGEKVIGLRKNNDQMWICFCFHCPVITTPSYSRIEALDRWNRINNPALAKVIKNEL